MGAIWWLTLIFNMAFISGLENFISFSVKLNEPLVLEILSSFWPKQFKNSRKNATFWPDFVCRHDDPHLTRNNAENEWYCLQVEIFTCPPFCWFFCSNEIFLDMILHFWSTLKYHVILFCRHDDYSGQGCDSSWRSSNKWRPI